MSVMTHMPSNVLAPMYWCAACAVYQQGLGKCKECKKDMSEAGWIESK